MVVFTVIEFMSNIIEKEGSNFNNNCVKNTSLIIKFNKDN